MEIDFLQIVFWLFAIEQVWMVKLGTYPYTIGLPLTRWKIPGNLESTSIGGFRIIGRIKIKKHENGDIFIRHMHFPLTWGPYVLAGHAKKEKPRELIIRVTPLTSIFFLTFVISGFFESIYSVLLALMVVFCFVLYFYSSITIGCQRIENTINDER